LRYRIILYALFWLLRLRRRYPAFAARLAERNLVFQIRTQASGEGRWYEFRDGRVRSGAGLHANPDVSLIFKTADIAARLLMPPIDQLEQVDAAKNFLMHFEGPDDDAVWVAQTIMAATSAPWKVGQKRADGTMRFCTITNGGPLHVYVRDGRIVR
ncbi:unnamed protein product, partial [Discosporangium mesarthrocarpum]